MDETDHLPMAVGVRCAGWPCPFCCAGNDAPARLGGMVRCVRPQTRAWRYARRTAVEEGKADEFKV